MASERLASSFKPRSSAIFVAKLERAIGSIQFVMCISYAQLTRMLQEAVAHQQVLGGQA